MAGVQFWAAGQPVPYNRESARYGRTAPRNAEWRGIIRAAFLDATEWAPPYNGPVRVTIGFWGARSGCDGDNLCKEVLDAFNGLAYIDDSQVVACFWEIGDWRPRGTRPPKGPRKVGALIGIAPVVD